MLLCVSIILIAHAGGYAPRSLTAQQQHLAPKTVATTVVTTAPTADTPSLSVQESTASHHSTAPSTATDTQAVCTASDKTQATDCSEPELVSHSDDFNFAPVNSQRFINLVQHDMREVKPVYLLAFEFVPESAPALGENIRLDARPDWTLLAESSPARISGWKVSNLQYRFSQQAA
ncbi:conserved hypothetical protein [Shewanella sp. ANA-3]|uniref:hypothetical protein n=1 Tax=Shewanella sp. (strain ANA-3) TaxID=94122 RepID=UPI00005DF0B7|nr:hypothetical protein [Shewanella sp. ANA-3]ABK47253.1 conserved hypothetical protein [Shewanella sp. ANA-3]